MFVLQTVLIQINSFYYITIFIIKSIKNATMKIESWAYDHIISQRKKAKKFRIYGLCWQALQIIYSTYKTLSTVIPFYKKFGKTWNEKFNNHLKSMQSFAKSNKIWPIS